MKWLGSKVKQRNFFRRGPRPWLSKTDEARELLTDTILAHVPVSTPSRSVLPSSYKSGVFSQQFFSYNCDGVCRMPISECEVLNRILCCL